jgi:excisionase family DNA binding protein
MVLAAGADRDGDDVRFSGDPRVYTLDEVAQLVKVARRTVEHWVRSGRLPVQRLGHRTVRVRREDLEAFLSGQGGHEPDGEEGTANH